MGAKDLSDLGKKEIVRQAKITHRRCELLIKQCDSWLSEEDGLKNTAKKRRGTRKRCVENSICP